MIMHLDLRNLFNDIDLLDFIEIEFPAEDSAVKFPHESRKMNL